MSTVVRDIPIDAIDLAPNVRSVIDDDADEELSASLDETGPLQPIRVRPDLGAPGRYLLVVGTRRFAAATMAGHATIPAVIDDRPPDPTRDAIEQLTENIQRQDLNPMDIAVALQRIMANDRSLSAAALARRLGKTKGWAHRHLGFLRLDPEVQDKLRKGRITAAHAVPIVSAPHGEQVRLARMAEGGVSSKALEQAAYPTLQRLTLTIADVRLTVSLCPDDGRYARLVVDAPEPLTTIDMDAGSLRRLVRTLNAIAAAIEAEHGHEPRTRERAKPTVYPSTRRPAKRPRRPGVRGGRAA